MCVRVRVRVCVCMCGCECFCFNLCSSNYLCFMYGPSDNIQKDKMHIGVRTVFTYLCYTISECITA